VSPLVIDASIAIKWVIEEEGTKEALALRNQALVAPDLLIAECANVLWKKVRRREPSDR
jgi:predicted nucleic acid-binding protein